MPEVAETGWPGAADCIVPADEDDAAAAAAAATAATAWGGSSVAR